MYVIAFLDRSNVSFAQEEFEADFWHQYGRVRLRCGPSLRGLCHFRDPYTLVAQGRGEVVAVSGSWSTGIVAAAFVFVQGPISFYILRFLLGVMEAGFFPGVILFLTYWCPPST